MRGYGTSRYGTSTWGVRPDGQLGSVPSGMRSQARDLSSGDYKLTPEGTFASMRPVGQRVLLALSTRLTSLSFDPTFGNDALNLRVDNGRLQAAVEDAVRRALANLVAEGAIAIKRITVEPSPGRLAYEVRWADLTDDSPFTTQGTILWPFPASPPRKRRLLIC